ncbi:hypothetical protein LCI18_005945 [Fusarium solani-melongenae]|uniref:Uncharacterized protein n=1 Tax=Fusarium solani subsp. cucurbitae TaxID=2747967 RepID=A0ACD3Z1E1_FUSSC|nr:hypothetical protein LCI18_005945 [Fusarium solani-melongenae]
MSNYPDHPYPRIPLPRDAPFVLKEATDGKGWGAYATRPIKKGGLIMLELPLFVIKKYEQLNEDALSMAFFRLSPHQKEMVGMARDNGGPIFRSFSAWLTQNSFSVDNKCLGFYLVQSRFNHSCQPNSAVPHTELKNDAILKRTALKDIEAGEEITFCYQPGLITKTRLQRHDQLWFECRCECCTLDPAASQLSDMRRTFMKALDYLAFGALPNGKIDTSERPLICDPVLKKTAENKTLPITSQFVYNILHMAIAEHEKVACLVIRNISPNIHGLANCFKSERNVRIANHALNQDTWLEALDVALLILGEPDESDNMVNEEINKIRAARMAEYLKNIIS